MAQNSDSLWKLALILDAAPDIIASEDIAHVREELQALGIDTGPLKEVVKETVNRWLQIVRAERGRRERRQAKKSTGRIQLPGEVMIQAIVKPWMVPAVDMAVPSHTPTTTRRLVAQVDELRPFRIEPHVRIDVKPARVGCMLLIALEPRARAGSAGRLLQPKRAHIEVELVRAGESRAKAVFSGTRLLQELKLADYEPGEEADWKANIRIGLPPRKRRQRAR